MEPATPVKNKIAYKWLSYGIVFAFIYYWALTLGLIFFNKSIAETTPRQTAFYHSFWKQTWRLFAYTKLYNRQLNFIVRDKQDPSKTDTLDLVQYGIAEKRKHAPVNAYYDGLEQMVYWIMNDVEVQMLKKEKVLKQQYQAKPDSFYMRQANILVVADSLHQQAVQNLANYGRYVMNQLHRDTAGKEFQLVLVHKFIAPAKPPAGSICSGDEQTIFISPFKPLSP